MTELYLRVLSLLYLLALCAVLVNALLNWERVQRRYPSNGRWRWVPKLVFVLSLLLLGAVIVINIRLMVQYITFHVSSDEANYISIMSHGDRGAGGPVSGPGYRLFVLFVHDHTPLSITDTVAGFASLVTICSLALLLFGYDRCASRMPGSGMAVLLLLTTSYFLWPIIEGRPQQLGMLLLFASVLLYWNSLKDRRFLAPFVAVFLLSFAYHLLTFMLVATTVSIIWWWEYVNKRADLKAAALPGSVILLCLLSLVPGLTYEHMVGGIMWALNRSVLSPLATPWMIVLTGLAPFFVLVLSGVLVRRTELVPAVTSLAGRYSTQITVVLCLAVVAVIVVQYWMDEDIYSYKYRHNFILFLIYQLGNMAFGLAFIIGMRGFLKGQEGPNVFLIGAIALMAVGGAIIVPSVLLPVGFNNWFIRVVNYWTLFAAPVAVRSVEKVPERYRKWLVLAVPALFVLSLININKDPFFLNVP